MRRAIGLASTTMLVLALVGGDASKVAASGSASTGDPIERTAARVEARAGVRCTITGTAGADHLHGTPHDDVICARGGADVVHALGGDDIIYLGKGADQARGGPGNDVIYGGKQGDTLAAGAGDDRVYGGPGDDFAHGGGHVPCCSDFRTFDGGRDLVSGGRGNDWCLWVADGTGNDTALGGPGFDTVKKDKRDQVAAERTNGEGCPG